MKVLGISFVLGLMVFACKSTSTTIPKEPNGNYIVMTLKGDSISTGDMNLNFNAETGQINGSGGCNNYSGTYTVSQDKIKFSQPMSTKKMCPGSADTEYKFFQALTKATRFELKKNIFKLYNEEKLSLTAKAVKQ